MSFAAGLEAGLLLGKKFGGGKKEPFRGISGTNMVLITYEYTDENNSANTAVKSYICDVKIFTKDVTITKTETDAEGNSTSTTFRESFSKTTIASISDEDGNVILSSNYNETTGKVSKYYDSDGKEISI